MVTVAVSVGTARIAARWRGMPRVAHPSLASTGLAEQSFPLVLVSVRIERTTVRPGELFLSLGHITQPQ